MLTLAAQFGIGDHPPKSGLAPAFLMIAAFALAGAVMLAVLERVVPRLRRRIRSRLSERRRLERAAGTELRCRAQMDELCPHGWRAQIVVFSSALDLPEEAPDPERVRVALDWAALAPGTLEEPIIARRLWAESIGQALEAMVSDRMTDETLQEIESRALAEGAEWPDLPA